MVRVYHSVTNLSMVFWRLARCEREERRVRLGRSMKMSETNQETRVFSLSGNHLSLDFVNTLNDREESEPRELLTSYYDLVCWGQQTGIMTDEQARMLLKEAEQH